MEPNDGTRQKVFDATIKSAQVKSFLQNKVYETSVLPNDYDSRLAYAHVYDALDDKVYNHDRV